MAGDDVFFIGARYAMSYMNQKITNYLITDSIWGNPTTTKFNTSSCYSHWIELLAGVKVELFHNIFLGWTIRGKFLLLSNHSVYYPQYIPGYGDGSSSSNFGWTYSIFYQFPLMKVKTHKRIKIEVPEPEEDNSNQNQSTNQSNSNQSNSNQFQNTH